MVYLLEAFGHQVSGTKDGAEGIELARQHQPDLILLDIHMPKMDGYEVARRLRADAQSRKIPVVAVTALAMVGDKEKLLASGFNGYISKPIEPENFAYKVQEFLGLRPLPEQACTPAPAVEEVGKESDLTPDSKRAVLLFVDNSAVNLQLARSILTPRGYEVISAPDVQQGLALAKKAKPDMIISDVHMPQQDGYDLIRLVQADPDLRKTPFVFLSSSVSSEREQDRALSTGATKFLCRPLDPQTLMDEIEACLRSRTGG